MCRRVYHDKKEDVTWEKCDLRSWLNGEYYESDENSLMVHMSKLRDKIEDDNKNPRYIKTVRGLGYKMERDL